MFFPLNQDIQGDDIQYDEDVNESLSSDIGEENHSEKMIKDQPTGPMTHSQMKQLMKANMLMSELFDQDFTFVPSAGGKPERQTREISLFTKLLNYVSHYLPKY